MVGMLNVRVLRHFIACVKNPVELNLIKTRHSLRVHPHSLYALIEVEVCGWIYMILRMYGMRNGKGFENMPFSAYVLYGRALNKIGPNLMVANVVDLTSDIFEQTSDIIVSRHLSADRSRVSCCSNAYVTFPKFDR